MPIRSFSCGRVPSANLMKRSVRYVAFMAACMLSHIPAAIAHSDDSPPSPEVTGPALAAFVLILIWVFAMCRHAPRMAHNANRRNTAQRKAPALLLLARILGWRCAAHPPRNASRQVRRAFVRHNRRLDDENRT